MALGCFAGFTGFDCSILWIIIVVLFFIAAILRKNVAEAILNKGFSIIGATALGVILYVIMLYITHSIKWSAILGIVGVVIGGFIGSSFLPDGESDSDGGGDGWF